MHKARQAAEYCFIVDWQCGGVDGVVIVAASIAVYLFCTPSEKYHLHNVLAKIEASLSASPYTSFNRDWVTQFH